MYMYMYIHIKHVNLPKFNVGVHAVKHFASTLKRHGTHSNI